MGRRFIVPVVSLLFVVGCGDEAADPPPLGSFFVDAGVHPDAESGDADVPDKDAEVVVDSGSTVDAAPQMDATTDAGQSMDVSTVDAQPGDADPPDAGAEDAATSDTGARDTGTNIDAGPMCSGNMFGWCADATLSCLGCPAGGPLNNHLCSTPCSSDLDCTDPARPVCNQPGTMVGRDAGLGTRDTGMASPGFCAPANFQCCWFCL